MKEQILLLLKDLSDFQMVLVVVVVIAGLFAFSSFAKWFGRKVSAGLVKKGEKKQSVRAEKIKLRKDEHLEHILGNQEMLKKD